MWFYHFIITAIVIMRMTAMIDIIANANNNMYIIANKYISIAPPRFLTVETVAFRLVATHSA